MKILFVLHNYHPSVGGTQYLFQNIAERLISIYNDDVTVYTTNSYYGPQRKQYKKIKEKHGIINGVKVMRFGYYNFFYSWFDRLVQLCRRLHITMPEQLKQLRNGPVSPTLQKALLRNEFDVVCASASDYNFMLYPLSRHKAARPKPFVFMGALHLAENMHQDNIFKQTLKAIKASEYYIANTSFEKNRLLNYGVKEESIKVVGCGVSLSYYEDISATNIRVQLNIKDDIILGYFGRHDNIKGISTILHAFKILSKNNTHLSLIIAGAASAYTKEIKTMIHSFDQAVQDKCFVLENVEEQHKAAILHAFDVFVYPSLMESFGIVFLEAWACKKPVIGADIGAVRSVINHGEDGYLIKPGDAEELVAYCTALINNAVLRNAMGMNGYNKVKLCYTLDTITGKYRAIFELAMAKFHRVTNTKHCITNAPV